MGSPQGRGEQAQARRVLRGGHNGVRDPLALTFPDPDHSKHEERFLTFGRSGKNRLLVVSHTDRDGLIRIISARKMVVSERRIYEDG